MRQAFTASKIFTGEEWLTDHSLVTADGWIESIVPSHAIGKELPIEDFGDSMITPAFIDVQVYGSGEKLFAQYPYPETLQLMQENFLKKGTVAFLPTVATNTIDTVKRCIDAFKKYTSNKGKGIPGLHLEGPWFNEKKRGAHIKEWIHPPEINEVMELLSYADGAVRMITLAPEVCKPGIIELIRSYGVIISAGHSDATFEETNEGFNRGIQAVTHLYNAMSPLQHREPGLVGAAFQNREVMVSIIPDGHHVAYEAISIAKKLIGPRLFAITDAVTTTGEGPYRHQMQGDKYVCNGVLSGSALSMYKAFRNLIREVGISFEEAIRMCSLYPAQAINLSGQYGRIAPHYTGQFLVMSKQLELARVIISG